MTALSLSGSVAGMASASALGLAVFTAGLASAAPPTEVVQLEPKVASQPVYSSTFSARPSGPFAKEPKVGQNVRRGLLDFAGGSEPMAFLWDQTQSRLWLDANRNKDLTDDSVNGYGPATKSGDLHTFSSIPLKFTSAARTQECVLDLQCYARASYSYYTAQVRSYWEGKVNLDGAEWLVGMVATPGQQSMDKAWFVLRPWSRRTEPFMVQDGSADTFPLSANLFIDRQGYAVNCQPEDGGRLRLEFAPTDHALGEVKLEGKFIHRLVLTDKTAQLTVVLNSPSTSAKVPVGRYESPHLVLGAGTTRATFNDRYSSSVSYKVTGNLPLVLAEGGPLTNSVQVTRHGASLSMAYELQGLSKRIYTLVGPRSEPRFSVLKGGKEIYSGKFEYG